MGTSAAAKLLELGRVLAGAESSTSNSGVCCHCRALRNPYTSTAQCPNVFCSEQCERDFVRGALASLTMEDCIRIQRRLETLLVGAEAAVL
jgi:hypothetical protein